MIFWHLLVHGEHRFDLGQGCPLIINVLGQKGELPCDYGCLFSRFFFAAQGHLIRENAKTIPGLKGQGL